MQILCEWEYIRHRMNLIYWKLTQQSNRKARETRMIQSKVNITQYNFSIFLLTYLLVTRMCSFTFDERLQSADVNIVDICVLKLKLYACYVIQLLEKWKKCAEFKLFISTIYYECGKRKVHSCSCQTRIVILILIDPNFYDY